MNARIFKGILLCLWLAMSSFGDSFANNVQISNAALTGNNLSFNISWENSWRANSSAPYNYDAIWVFVKYRDCATGQWSHAFLDSAAAATPLTADTTTDNMGVFVYRASDGTGTISNIAVTVRLAGMPSGNFDFKIFGIEMVYVPQGAFYLGDGNAANGFRTGTNSSLPFLVTSENSISVANSGSNLYASAAISTGTINAAWPKGFAPFYCMKYEISQEQYAEFLNTLTSTQANARYLVSTTNRYTLTGAWPVITTTAGNRAINNLNYDDFTAYLDWSGLRPMTELEFEKACRGPAVYNPGEYAWGTGLVTDAVTLVNDGTPSESISNAIPAGSGIANFNNNTILGPLRCGFNGGAGTNRLTLGATYYGICEMSGNVYERVIYAGSAIGLSFRPNHGDGSITPTGLSDVPNWPAVNGSGLRGGGWNSSLSLIEVSNRSNATFSNNTRYNYIGGRGVRTP